MTNRMDHTRCYHTATPAARAKCRAMRRDAIRTAQKAYAGTQDGTFDVAEYEAMIDIFAGNMGMDLMDAYDLIEHGPVVL